MTTNANRIFKQFARVGKVFSRPMVRNKYPSLLLLDDDFEGSSLIENETK